MFDALGLDFDEYARTKDLILNARDDKNASFRDVLEYRLDVDLQRGWRLTAPNLDQVGLLHIEYQSLRAVAASVRFMVGARGGRASEAYSLYRRSLGRAILLGLEFLVAGDIIRTVAISPTSAALEC